MATCDDVRLYRSTDLPGHWIGDDKRGGLVTWPTSAGGWDQRTPFKGSRRGLEEVEPALARGTGWPGAGGGRRPNAASGRPGKNRTIRASDDEWEAWRAAADARTVSDWARDELNAAAERKKKA